MEFARANALKKLEEQEAIEHKIINLIDAKTKNYIEMKEAFEMKKLEIEMAKEARKKRNEKILAFEKFLHELMQKGSEQFENGARKLPFDNEELDKLFLSEAYDQLNAQINDLSEKYSIQGIQENIKRIEMNTLEMENDTVKLQTSNQRKKKQLQINLSGKEEDIDDAITNSVRQLELIADKVKDKKDRMNFMQMKKEQLLKDIKEKEVLVAKREVADKNFKMQIQTLEPDRFHSQPQKETNEDREISRHTTQ